MQRILKPMIVMLAIALPMTAAAQVYSWTDASGTVHYSQAPPGHGIKYHIVPLRGMDHAKGPADTATGDAASADDSGSTADAGGAANTPANRKHFCDQLQGNIKLLQSDQMVSFTDANGIRTPLTPEKRAAEAKRAKAQYDAYCTGE